MVALAHQHQVDDSLEVDLIAKVFVIAPREPCADAVVRIHHTRHSIEPESVKLEFLQVITQVRKQEPQHLVMAVIEQPTACDQSLAYERV